MTIEFIGSLIGDIIVIAAIYFVAKEIHKKYFSRSCDK